MERIDNIGFGQLKLIQNPEEFCYGVDAVLLADFAAKRWEAAGKDVAKLAVDLGTGTGIIPHILSFKTGWKEIIGIEVQDASYDRAVRNSKLNGLEERLKFINADVLDYKIWGEGFMGKAEVVVSNPPYTEGFSGIKGVNEAKGIARHESTANLRDFMRSAAYLLKDKGSLFMVHRPSRLVDIFSYGREAKLEAKEICLVSPKINSTPNIVLVHLVKNGGKQLNWLETISVYDNEGNYTKQVLDCYK